MMKIQKHLAGIKLLPVKTNLAKLMSFGLMILLIALPTMANDALSQSVNVRMAMRNSTVADVIKEFSKQTGYEFSYDAEILNRKVSAVSINAKSENVETVLKQIFEGTDIDFKIVNNRVFLKNNKTSESAPGTSVSAVQQQGKTVTGVVVDNLGDPVIGATIVVRGDAGKGTVTDIDGKFVLTNIPENAVLEISYVGMKTQTVEAAGKSSFNIALLEDLEMLDELVVVGYGVQKKVNVIGSISQVDNKKLENRSAPALSNMLTGQMPGVTVIQRSGKLGESGGTIRVRGVGSFGADPDALVLIDGIPGSINDIRPEDVDNISVLKDASTAAIYGSRAANGVILITTKTGRKGGEKINVSYSGYLGFNQATALPEFINSWEWADLYNKAKGGVPTYSDTDIQKMKDGSDPDRFANENYLKTILDNRGVQTGHDISVNGGSDTNQYLISYGIISQDGIVEKNNYTRHNARVNVINQLSSNLKLTTRLSGLFAQVNEPNVPGGDDASGMLGIIQKAVRFPGLFPTRTSSGDWGMGPENHGTPVSWVKSSSFFTNERQALSANVNMEYKPIKDLLFSGTGAYNFSFGEDRGFKSTHKLEGDRILGPSFFKNTIEKRAYKSFQAIADYNKSISYHNFGILGGYSWEEQQERNLEGTRDNFPSDNLPQLNAGSASNMQNAGTTNEWALQSLFGRLRYNFREKYLFETTMRYDGSSKFPQNDKYALFPSAGIGWRVSEESFIRNNPRLTWVDNLKVKASAGKLGNQNIGNYPYQSVYKFGFNYPFGSNFQQGAAVSTLVDPTLRWEETSTYDIGFESAMKNGLLSADVNYFYRKTTDILYAPGGSVSNVLGMTPSVMNTGSLKNTGWEFEIGHRNNLGGVNYSIGANFSIIKNEVLSLGVGNVKQLNGLVGNGSSLFVDYPMEIYYGYVADGVFLDDSDIAAWTDQKAVTPNAKPGDIRYVDISGPDGVPDGKVDSQYDRVYLGSRIPKYTYGITLGADYKGLDFQMLLQGVGGVKGRLNNYAGYAFFSDKGNVQRWQVEGAFDSENPVRYPSYPRIEILSNVETPNTVASSFWIQDASYLRIRTIQLGYTIPAKITSKMKLNSLRLYLQAENPLTWHNYPKGWDPEINTGGDFYPILRTYTFGLNLKF